MSTTSRCGEPLYTVRCDLPEGHDPGGHAAARALPPEVNMMIAEALDGADEAAIGYRKARGQLRLATGGMVFAASLNLTAYLLRLWS